MTLQPAQLRALLLIARGICLRADLADYKVSRGTLNALVTKKLVTQRWHNTDQKRDYFHATEDAREWLKAAVSGLGLDMKIVGFDMEIDRRSYTANVGD